MLGQYLRYGTLATAGVVLIVASVLNISLAKSQACGSNPNCPNNGSWTVKNYGCNAEACSCTGGSQSYTCYYESGICNDSDPPRGAYYSHCYQYNCTCSSSGGGGGGGGGGGEEGGDCWSDWDCSAGSQCCAGTCQQYSPFGCLQP
jgi:hypothetical protein